MLNGLTILAMPLAAVTWLWAPINFLFLIFDGITYTLVAAAYKVFQLMAQLNFSTLELLFGSLFSRIRAIIAVLILFIIGYALVQYLVNPDKAADKNKAGGVALIKNIAIGAILLVLYPAIFGIMNEFTLLLVGTPTAYGEYTYLGPIFGVEGKEADEGAIMRFINGGNGGADDETEEVDFGRKLAVTTLSSFLHGYEGDGLYSRSEGYDKSVVGQILSEAVKADDFNLIFTLPSAVSSIGVTVEYWPLISTALGAYIIYMLITVSIQLGIRAFKILVLQLIAPIAIITIMTNGWSSNIWKKYLSVLGKTYTDAFIRIGAMYFSFSFITVAFNNLNKIFDNVPNSNLSELVARGVVIIAVLKLGKEVPQLIDSIFGSKLAENNKMGLSQFLGAAGGYVLGTGSGAISGAITRARKAKANGASLGRTIASGLGGAVDGAVTGGFSGAAGGFKAKGGNIAEIVKNSTSKGWETGSVGIGGYIAGAAESLNIGHDGRINVERQAVNNLKESKQHALNIHKGDSATKINVGGKDYKVDITGGKANAIAKVKASESYRQLLQELDNIKSETINTSDPTAVANKNSRIAAKTTEINNVISEVGKTYDKVVEDVLTHDEDYQHDVKTAQRYFDRSDSEFNGKSDDTINQLEYDILFREQKKQRRDKLGGGGKK